MAEPVYPEIILPKVNLRNFDAPGFLLPERAQQFAPRNREEAGFARRHGRPKNPTSFCGRFASQEGFAAQILAFALLWTSGE
jgi:hypothetical protein